MKKIRKRSFLIDTMQNEDKEKQGVFNPKDYYQLGLNIAALRKAHGENQMDLAASVGVTKSAISNYETGQRIPQRDVLNAISKHYNIPVSRLMHGDVSEYSLKNIPINDASIIRMSIETMFPLVCTGDAMGNKHFKEAMKMHNNIKEAVYSGIKSPEAFAKYLADCESLYEKSIEDGVCAAHANLLWWPFFILVGSAVFSADAIDSMSLVSKDKTVLDFYKLIMPSVDRYDEAWEIKKQEWIEHYREDICTHLYYLKQSSDSSLSAIADYYIALGYTYCLLNPDLISAESRIVGQEMMNVCYSMDNPYAVNLASFQSSVKSKE